MLRAATAAVLLASSAGVCPAADGVLTPESATHFEDAVRPVLEAHCGDCHHPEDPDNHVRFLDAAVADDLSDARGLWANVAEQLRNRTMPPADAAQPSEADRIAVADWVDARLRATACDRGEYAGPVVARRLNREEYANTVRDLLRLDLAGLDWRPSETFPADGGGGEGFDNNGETLFLPPILMERYLQAASEAVERAVWTPPLDRDFGPGELDVGGDSEAKVDDDRLELPPGGRASAAVRVHVAADVTVTVKADGPADAPVALRVDGVPAETLTLDGAGGVPQRARTVVRLARGEHRLTVENAGAEALFVRGLGVRDDRPDAPPPHVAASHRFLLGVEPGEVPADPRAAVTDALRRLARRAYRRPVTDADLAPLTALADRAFDRGDRWEEAFKLAARAVLVSPKFLFRTEPPPPVSPSTGAVPGEPAFVGDHALASRLSYFLWASMPDEELFAAADAGRLSDPAELGRQVDRMLDDPRADAFADAFAGQWLGTREVGSRVAPDVNAFRDQFDDPVLDDLRRQPTELFAYLLREDRPLSELIDADYAVLNDRLAYFYGLADPSESLDEKVRRGRRRWMRDGFDGGAWRRVDLDEVHRERRGGVLGLGAVLLATSRPHRTSPVLRGAWVLETLLGTKVPPPPPDVPDLKVSKQDRGASVREKLAAHRADPACSACHDLMDPLGFALDDYDAIGRWRGEGATADSSDSPEETDSPEGADSTEETDPPTFDTSARLPTGEEFAGPGGLRRVLLGREDRVVRHLTAKLLGYALGRSLEDGDDCTIGRIADRVMAGGGSARSLVKAVAASAPFRTAARGDAPAAE